MENQKDEFEKMAEEIEYGHYCNADKCQRLSLRIADALRKVHNDAVEECSLKAERTGKYGMVSQEIADEIRKLKKD